MKRADAAHVLFLCDRAVSDPVVETVSRELGQVLAQVTSAGEAMAYARDTDLALVLVGYNGDSAALQDTIRALRANPRSSQTPVVVLGVPAGAGFDLDPFYEAGAIAVVAAPVSPTILKTKARFYLETFASANERRRAEAALVETSARLEATIDAAEVGTWTWDIAPDRVTGDERLRAMFGLAPGVTDGMPLAHWFAGIHPDDAAPTRALIDQAVRDGVPYDATFRLSTPDGWRWVIARGRVEHGPGGKPLRLRGVVIDATRQIQAELRLHASEERYRILFDSLDEGVCVIEVLFNAEHKPGDYRFLEVNPAFVAQTGLTDAVGKCMRALAPAHEQHWFDVYGRVASTGEAVRFTHQAKALGRWYDVYATRIGPAEAHRVAILFNDVSEQRHAEDELRRLAADLAESNRLKTEFLATLAHELRNPLAPIRSGLHLMRRATDASAIARVQDIMDRQLDHLVNLVDDLLDVARITRGQVELKRDWIDLAQVLSGAVEASTPLIDASRHELAVEMPPEPVRLYADATRITQVVSNLLNNAAKYTPRGGRIVLAARLADGQVEITVSDNGVGIANTALPEVFKMFTQIGAEPHRAYGGLGIGLSLVRTFVELHGGTVSAASAGLGAGSVFTVRLPLAPADAAAAPPQEVHDTDAASGAALRVLVVDDNRDAAETLSALLDVMGHAAPIANDGQQALRMMHSFEPEVVFLDIGMPGMSGYEVASAIRREHCFDKVSLVALTGWGGELDRARSAEAGFDEHLTKPATIDAIEQVLAKAAARR
jgi:signal transduction histidine kinase/DNA-binding response OmpR family regulator